MFKKSMVTMAAMALLLSGFEASAASYCKASKKTTRQIEQLRIVELPYQIVESKVVKALITDRCVRKRLSDEEILTLKDMLLSYDYSEDTAAQIIGEFLAQ
ncbi:hypothetical protein QJS83_10265 [Bdellovibrio sp. 22V]|uniref:hypothetical protein n=1 Tax=Bdellovibrio sp. 22V TaxID=3044166 RepID=UPI0025431DD6|nr:hypothetical protein [Bdellovibrio sp. 22V]WII70844.1 hypothetical protein QJS83_10265 [Bdellovibrio sp. 22V]